MSFVDESVKSKNDMRVAACDIKRLICRQAEMLDLEDVFRTVVYSFDKAMASKIYIISFKTTDSAILFTFYD